MGKSARSGRRSRRRGHAAEVLAAIRAGSERAIAPALDRYVERNHRPARSARYRSGACCRRAPRAARNTASEAPSPVRVCPRPRFPRNRATRPALLRSLRRTDASKCSRVAFACRDFAADAVERAIEHRRRAAVVSLQGTRCAKTAPARRARARSGRRRFPRRGSRSRAIWRMMRACCASLRPKNAKRGCTISKSFSTTVVTPRKWPGRERPSSRSLRPSTVTHVRNPGG